MVFHYQRGNSWFHQLDPLSKLIWLACVSALCILYADVWVQITLFGAVITIGRLAAGMPLKIMWRSIRFPFWFGVPYFFLQLIFVSGQTPLMRWGSFILTEEALSYAAAITLRLLTLVLSSFLFVATTDPRDLVISLSQQMHLPYRFAFAISLALRFLPLLKREALSIQAAQQLRGMNRSQHFFGKLRWGRRFLLSLFLNTVRKVEGTASAMEIKGFGVLPSRTWRKEIRLTPGGWLLLLTSSIATVSCVIGELVQSFK